MFHGRLGFAGLSATAVVLALAASVASASAADCAARVSRTWSEAGGDLVVDAAASGARCAKATVALTIRTAAGKVLFTFKGTADSNLAFAEAKTKPQMQAALKQWLDDGATTLPTSDKLPPWTAGDDQPQAGEFAFYVEEGVTQPIYARIRSARRPMFCFVQGMESTACVVIGTDGAATKVGAQSFPG